MAKANSFKNQPWSSFDKNAYCLMTDNFVHDKLLTIKANIKSSKGNINLKHVLNNKDGALTSTGQTKLWFPILQHKTLYAVIKPNVVRLHFDNGMKSSNGWLYNLYGSIQSARNLSKNTYLKIGAEVTYKEWRNNLRLRADCLEKCFAIYNKWRYIHNQWTVQGFKGYDMCKSILLRNALLLKYTKNQNEFCFRAQNQGWRNDKINYSNFKQLFQKFTLNYTRTMNETETIGVQTSFNNEGKNNGFAVAWESKMSDSKQMMKIKLESQMKAAIAIKQFIGSYGSYTFGVQVSELGTNNTIKYGFQLDLNV